jgi:hypothetical protein
MKLLCDACEQVVPLTQVRSENGALLFACPSCGAQGRIDAEPAGAGATVERAAKAGPASPMGRTAQDEPTTADGPVLSLVPGAPRVPFAIDPPATHCPKCIEPRETEAQICPRCGLVFANFVPEEVAPPPELAERWRNLFSCWEDAAAHERVVLEAARLGALPQLARLYRVRLAQDPTDTRAQVGRERIIALVASTPLPKTEGAQLQRERIRVIQYVLFAVMMLAILALLFKVVRR